LVILSFCCTSAAQTQPGTEQKPIEDNWYSVQILGQDAGYMHDKATRVEKGGVPLIETEITMELNIERLGVGLRALLSQRYTETADGKPVAFTNLVNMGGTGMSSEGKIQGKNLILKESSGGPAVETVIPWEDGVKFPAAAEAVIRSLGRKKGAREQFRIFVPEAGKFATATVECQGEETVDILGTPQTLIRYRQSQDILAGVDTQLWMDDENHVIKTRTSLGGIAFETYRVNEKTARKEAPGVEMLRETLIRSKTVLTCPRDLSFARYVLRSAGGDLDTVVLAHGNRQKITSRTPEQIELVVDANAFDTEPVPGETYLKPNPLLQSDDPRIVKMAREAVGDETDPLKQARLLEQWVFKKIRQKDLGVGFASAAEVAENLEGDCTEHAVLLAALARAVNIPSRVACGLVYLQGIFGYHMWTEVSISGRWIPLDATLGEGFVDATHIKLADSSLETSSLDIAMGVASTLNRFGIEIPEYRLSNGITVKTGEPGKKVHRMQGSTYENRVFGFRFEKPGSWGWTVEKETPEEVVLRLTAPKGRGSVEIKARPITSLLTAAVGGTTPQAPAPSYEKREPGVESSTDFDVIRWEVPGKSSLPPVYTLYDRDIEIGLRLENPSRIRKTDLQTIVHSFTRTGCSK
jgi:hypothetical protein